MSSKLIKSKARVKDAGEVFTPSFLVEQMLDSFPPDAWDKDKNWLEPTCGNGNFIIAILNRKITKKGFGLIEALNTTFGMDLMRDNILECKQRIYQEVVLPLMKNGKGRKLLPKIVCIVQSNIVITGDSLAEDWNNRFQHFDSLSKEKRDANLANAEKALIKILDAEIAPTDLHFTFHKSLLALRKDFRKDS